ncbi:hypothetical protein OBBRIDRAFT_831886 [Obba rivulosa]|uniref:Uncharacterized protein n=1 Tax=Obba rivulosa TaxID=1052685 RepID=A0A8E2J494_9APHY|nr:hypothetical protein OBBRIDRAFT_831886 [Obba rivulosa]
MPLADPLHNTTRSLVTEPSYPPTNFYHDVSASQTLLPWEGEGRRSSHTRLLVSMRAVGLDDNPSSFYLAFEPTPKVAVGMDIILFSASGHARLELQGHVAYIRAIEPDNVEYWVLFNHNVPPSSPRATGCFLLVPTPWNAHGQETCWSQLIAQRPRFINTVVEHPPSRWHIPPAVLQDVFPSSSHPSRSWAPMDIARELRTWQEVVGFIAPREQQLHELADASTAKLAPPLGDVESAQLANPAPSVP